MASKQPKAPISAHPLFPAVVAVWFAALFGLGSGVLPNILFEHFVTLTGISTLVPAAAPPLGATARILFSLTAALGGGALGFLLARKVAAGAGGARTASAVSRLAPRPDPLPPMDVKRRPISVEDLGDTKLDPSTDEEPTPSAQPIAGRRRSLAMAEDDRPSEFLHAAPMRAQEPPAPEPSEEPLDLISFAEPEPAPVSELAPEHAGGFIDPRVEPESIVDRGLSGLRNPSPFAAPSLFAAPLGDEEEEPVNADGASFAPPPFAQAAEDEAMPHEPLPFAPPAQTAAPAPEPAPTPAPMQVFAAAAEIPKPVLPADPEADLETMGMVQLTERLGSSLQKRLGRPKSPPAFVDGLKADLGIETAAPAPAVPAFAAAAAGAEAIEPGMAIFGQAAFDPVTPGAPPPPPVIPAALRPLPLELETSGEDEDIDSHVASLSLPLGGFAPAAPSAEEEDEPVEELGEEENYSSLLTMKHPFRAPAEFVRVEEPEPEADAVEPAVVFPGADAAPQPLAAQDGTARPFDAPAQAAAPRNRPNPEETERALRSALSTLQRMGSA